MVSVMSQKDSCSENLRRFDDSKKIIVQNSCCVRSNIMQYEIRN